MAAALNPHVFDAFILFSTLVILFGWFVVYTNAKEQKILNPDWLLLIQQKAYIYLINRFYVDQVYVKWGDTLYRLAQKVAHRH
jgi:hypothetical protein